MVSTKTLFFIMIFLPVVIAFIVVAMVRKKK